MRPHRNMFWAQGVRSNPTLLSTVTARLHSFQAGRSRKLKVPLGTNTGEVEHAESPKLVSHAVLDRVGGLDG